MCFLCVQMLLYHVSIVLCYVPYFYCVADVIVIIKNFLCFPSVKIGLSDKFTVKIMWPPLLTL